MLHGRTRIVSIVAALALAAGAAVLWLRPPHVRVEQVEARDFVVMVHAVGTVEVKSVVAVAAKVTGRITAVLVDQGDVVEPGQVLVRLDDAQAAAEVARAEQAVRVAEAQQRDVEAGARAEEVAEARANVERARAQLDDLRAGSRPQEIEEARERHRAAGATRVLAEREFGRVQRLHADGLVATAEVDRTRQALDVAQAQERAARETLGLAEEGPRRHQVDNARANLDAQRARLALLEAGPRPHQLAAARAQVLEAQAALRLARERHADAAVRSPLTGYVVGRDLEPGATVNPATPILKIADPRTAWATVHVDERHTGSLTVGDEAEVTLRSQPGGAVRGRVARIRRETDRVTEQLAVDIVFETAPARLTLGEQVEARIRSGPRRVAVAVPAAALVRGRAGPGVWLVIDGRLALRDVRPGGTDAGGYVEILDGLRAGETVVVAPRAVGAAEGRRVRVDSRSR